MKIKKNFAGESLEKKFKKASLQPPKVNNAYDIWVNAGK